MANQSFDAIIQYAHAAIRGAFLLNGGSCVALLAFLGTSEVVEICQCGDCTFSSALQWFALGAMLAIITSAISYLSQSAENSSKFRLFNYLRAFACLVYSISLIFFFLGLSVAKLSLVDIGV